MRFDEDVNAWSLGGIWRSAAPDALDADGWADVTRAGIVRIVDLRNASERVAAPDRPSSIDVVYAPLEDPEDPDYTALWDRNWAHPDFYAWGLGHWPELWRTALTAIAAAPGGGVLIHCAGGRDRTGMLSAILQDAAGVDRAAVLDDYERGMRGTNEMLRRQGRSAHEAAIPADRLEDILRRYRAGLDALLDLAPDLLMEQGLSNVAERAAARLTL